MAEGYRIWLDRISTSYGTQPKLLRRGVDIRALDERSPLRTINAASVMKPNFPTVLPTMLISDLVNKIRRTGHHGFPVVDEQGDLQGVVTVSDVEAAMAEGDPTDKTDSDIASKSVIVAYPDQYLHDVLVKLGAREVGRIPVVRRDNPKQLLGVLRRQDIIRAYSKVVTRKPHR